MAPGQCRQAGAVAEGALPCFKLGRVDVVDRQLCQRSENERSLVFRIAPLVREIIDLPLRDAHTDRELRADRGAYGLRDLDDQAQAALDVSAIAVVAQVRPFGGNPPIFRAG